MSITICLKKKNICLITTAFKLQFTATIYPALGMFEKNILLQYARTCHKCAYLIRNELEIVQNISSKS